MPVHYRRISTSCRGSSARMLCVLATSTICSTHGDEVVLRLHGWPFKYTCTNIYVYTRVPKAGNKRIYSVIFSPRDHFHDTTLLCYRAYLCVCVFVCVYVCTVYRYISYVITTTVAVRILFVFRLVSFSATYLRPTSDVHYTFAGATVYNVQSAVYALRSNIPATNQEFSSQTRDETCFQGANCLQKVSRITAHHCSQLYLNLL